MKKLSYTSIISILFCGCSIFNPDTNPRNYQKETTSVLIIGANISYGGDTCVGVEHDVGRAYEMFSHYSYDIKILQGEDATAENVLDAMNDVCNNELAIIYYTGHGGSYKTGNPEEYDGCDEFLALYDYSIWDNDIWNIVSCANGNVLLIFDCCHSETMFKTNYKLMQRLNSYKTRFGTSGTGNRILCWSGCPDDKYSYANDDGGYFTNSIYENWKYLTRSEDNTASYEDVFQSVRKDWNLIRKQSPRQTIINNFPISNKVFQ